MNFVGAAHAISHTAKNELLAPILSPIIRVHNLLLYKLSVFIVNRTPILNYWCPLKELKALYLLILKILNLFFHLFKFIFQLRPSFLILFRFLFHDLFPPHLKQITAPQINCDAVICLKFIK